MTLPPLPEPDFHQTFDVYMTGGGGGNEVIYFTAKQMREYAAAAVDNEREACAKLCDQTPPYPFRPSIEAAHAIRARSSV